IDSKSLQRLSHMRAAAERGAKLTDQLLSFHNRQRLQHKTLNLNGIIHRMQNQLQSTMGGSIDIRVELQPDLWCALADPTQVELAILNLTINARDAMPAGGRLFVRTSNISRGAPASPEDRPAGDYVELCVSD